MNKQVGNQKCWVCGKPAAKKFLGNRFTIGAERCYCDKCFDEVSSERAADLKEYLRLKKKLMVERAIRLFEKQNVNIYDYVEAIDAIKEYSASNIDKFDSAHEMLAAMILIDNEIETKVQHKVGKYRVDFMLPTLKVILEIDGYLHEHSGHEDNKRDFELREILGHDWEIVRIDTKYLEQNVELLVEAIKTIKAEKQKLRRDNYGLLPEWYSKRQSVKRRYKKQVSDDLLL